MSEHLVYCMIIINFMFKLTFMRKTSNYELRNSLHNTDTQWYWPVIHNDTDQSSSKLSRQVWETITTRMSVRKHDN